MSMSYRDMELGQNYWVVVEHASPPELRRATVTELRGQPGAGWGNVRFAGVRGSPGNVFHAYDRGVAETRLMYVRQEWMYRQVERMDTRLSGIEKAIRDLGTVVAVLAKAIEHPEAKL